MSNPAKKTTNNPTNFTETQQASMVPVKNNHHHQINENSGVLLDDNLTAPNTDAIMKQSRIGSNKMYWVNVNKPTSGTNEIFEN